MRSSRAEPRPVGEGHYNPRLPCLQGACGQRYPPHSGSCSPIRSQGALAASEDTSGAAMGLHFPERDLPALRTGATGRTMRTGLKMTQIGGGRTSTAAITYSKPSNSKLSKIASRLWSKRANPTHPRSAGWSVTTSANVPFTVMAMSIAPASDLVAATSTWLGLRGLTASLVMPPTQSQASTPATQASAPAQSLQTSIDWDGLISTIKTWSSAQPRSKPKPRSGSVSPSPYAASTLMRYVIGSPQEPQMESS